MSTPFECYLEDIADDYSDTGEYWPSFKAIKEHVVQRLNYDYEFRSYFKDSFPFGPAAHGTQLYGDRGKFSVTLELEIPHYKEIALYGNNDEYLKLCVENVPHNLPMEDDCHYINRWFLQQWLKDKFLDLLKSSNMSVAVSYCQTFSLSYQLRGMRHTIFAKPNSDSKELIIDFVPAIKVVKQDSSIDFWHAIPKLMPDSQANYSFMMSNTRYEKTLLEDNDLKNVMILMQLLCHAKGLTKIRYYHLMNLVLAKKIDFFATEHSLQYIFVEILRELYNAIYDEHLPHCWDDDINLLSNISSKVLSDYEIILDKAYDTLSTYSDQENLSYARCLSHFE
ncbi:hypothetical protein ACLKA7_012844 [Drosophila subpalustris]